LCKKNLFRKDNYSKLCIIKKNTRITIRKPARSGVTINIMSVPEPAPGDSIGAELKKSNPKNNKNINAKTIIAPFK
jgi:hypothetical protein